MKLKCNIDAISFRDLRFVGLSGRDRSKVHGKDSGGFCSGKDSALIEDILHSMGCDLFGSTRYNITIEAQEIPNVKQKKAAKKTGS